MTPIVIVRKVYPAAVLARVRRAKKWRAAAYHEAGHAVARLALGTGVRCLQLFPCDEHEDCLGWCVRYYRRPTDEVNLLLPQPAWKTRRKIMFLLAGNEAEYRLTGRRNMAGADSDYKSAVNLLPYSTDLNGGEDVEASRLLEAVRQQAQILVADRCASIEAVAEALLASDTLSLMGREVKRAAHLVVKPSRRTAA